MFRTKDVLEIEQRIKGKGRAEYLDMLKAKGKEEQENGRRIIQRSRAERGEWFRPVPEETDLGPDIKVLPTLPWMRFVHSCPKCGCHAVSKVGGSMSDGWESVVCANCSHGWEVYL